MTEEIQQFLGVLERRPFNKAEKIVPLVKRLFGFKAHEKEDEKVLFTLARWLVVPYTLWPVDFAGICKRLRIGAHGTVRVPDDVRLLLSLVEQLPDSGVQEQVAEFEKNVKAGTYELLIDSQTKVKGRELEMLDSDMFREDWCKTKNGVNLKWIDGRGKVKRRSMVQERNFKPHFPYDPKDIGKRNQAVFDAFCYRWNLYGLESGRPLPLKPSVNITPHGTMIFIPSRISLDKGRDIHWKEIKKLHKIWNPPRQGKVFSLAPHQRRLKAAKAYNLWRSLKGQRLSSTERYDWIKGQLGYVSATDDSTIRKLVSEGKRASRNSK